MKGHTYYLNNSAALSMYYLLLPPGAKGLTGLHQRLQFDVRTYIGFKEFRHMYVLRHCFLTSLPATIFHFVSLRKGPFCNIYYDFAFDTNQTDLKRCILQIHYILKIFLLNLIHSILQGITLRFSNDIHKHLPSRHTTSF